MEEDHSDSNIIINQNLYPMAIQAAAYLKGKIDNVVFYQRSGIYIARSIPDNVKQSAATRQRSINFGIASSAGKTLRQLLSASIVYPRDKKMQGRFSGSIAQWLGISNVSGLLPVADIPFLKDFSFNGSTKVAERFRVPFSISLPSDNLLQVYIPSFVPAVSMAAPAHTVAVKFIITAAACRLKDATAMGNFSVTLTFPYTNDTINEQTISFPVNTEAGNIVIVAGLMKFKLHNGQTDMRPSFIPSSVMDARYC